MSSLFKSPDSPRDVRIKAPAGLTREENSELTLHCTANAFPEPSFTWWKVTPKGPELQLEGNHSLVFNSLRASDSGQYRCSASNHLGSNQSEWADVKVECKWKFMENISRESFWLHHFEVDHDYETWHYIICIECLSMFGLFWKFNSSTSTLKQKRFSAIHGRVVKRKCITKSSEEFSSGSCCRWWKYCTGAKTQQLMSLPLWSSWLSFHCDWQQIDPNTFQVLKEPSATS